MSKRLIPALTVTSIFVIYFSIAINNPPFGISPTSAQTDDNGTGYKTVDYYARFNCGSIDNDNGPLRPGKYDSDITIFNKKNFPLTIIWKAIEVNQQETTNFNIVNIPPENIVNINCANMYSSRMDEDNKTLQNNFAEGVVLLRINVNNGQLMNNIFSNQAQSVILDNSELGNLVNVDVLHTVNTLSDLNKEALYLKVKFSLGLYQNDAKGSAANNLTAVFKVEPNQILNSTALIENAMANSKNITLSQSNVMDIKIDSEEIILQTLIDNHALTVQRIQPLISDE
jgi:hypothetical protein